MQATCACARLACRGVLEQTTCIDTFGGCDGDHAARLVDYTGTSIMTAAVPNAASLHEACFTHVLDDVFRDLSKDTWLLWQYFGTPSGMTRMYPATLQSSCYTCMSLFVSLANL